MEYEKKSLSQNKAPLWERQHCLLDAEQKNCDQGFPPYQGVTMVSYEEVEWALQLHGWSHDPIGNQTTTFANFEGIILRGISLDKITLKYANFRNADLTGCRGHQVHFNRSCFVGAQLQTCIFTDSEFVLSDCSYADFSQVSMPSTRFLKAALYGANLTLGDFREADFFGADLSDTLVNETNFTKARLIRANLTGMKGMHLILDDAEYHMKDQSILLGNGD